MTTKPQSSNSAAVLALVVSLVLCVTVVWFRDTDQAISDSIIASESEANQFGHSPSDKEIMDTFRVYARYQAPAGLFGEVTQNLLIDEDPVSMKMIGNVEKMIGYAAGADGVSFKERSFVVTLASVCTGGRLTPAMTMRYLKSSISQDEALDILKQGYPMTKLYWMAVVAMSDGEFTENEKQKMIDLADAGNYKGSEIIQLVEREAELKKDLMSIMQDE